MVQHVVCAAEEVPEGTALRVDVDGVELAVFHVAGGFHVTDDACTHGPGRLSDGELEGSVVECDFHLGRFDVVTGAAVGPPCLVPVRTYPTVVADGKVLVEVGPAPRRSPFHRGK